MILLSGAGESDLLLEELGSSKGTNNEVRCMDPIGLPSCIFSAPFGICFELNRFAPCGYSRAGATGDYQVWAWKREGRRDAPAFGIIWINVRFNALSLHDSPALQRIITVGPYYGHYPVLALLNMSGGPINFRSHLESPLL